MSQDEIRPLPDSLDATIAELGALLLKGYVRYRRGREWIERVEGEAIRSPVQQPTTTTKTPTPGDSEN